MITATCKQKDCKEKDIDYFVLGDPAYVECGNCGSETMLTNKRPDPEELTT
jgi:hypothetical protein